MPITRSASALAAAASPRTVATPADDGGKDATSKIPRSASKRKTSSSASSPRKKPRTPLSSSSTSLLENVPPVPPKPTTTDHVAIVPAELTFSFDSARDHLIQADHRFADIFDKMECRPFQHLEQTHPFRALATSIIGQQIAWSAARAIQHKFIRLYDPSLPEKVADYKESRSPTSFFPIAEHVAITDPATLKAAGLSGRKAEYIRDLAQKFADGHLTTEKLLEANDEDLAEMLISVKGIGRWTVDMFAMFSLRRPDILPVGDLGVQRGLIRWVLALHSPDHPFSMAPDKASHDKGKNKDEANPDEDDSMPANVELPNSSANIPSVDLESPSTPFNPSHADGPQSPAFTPSVSNILHKVDGSPPPLPQGLTVSELKLRLSGKKKIKGALLTPVEMEELTESWKPYRSLGVYYMWRLAEGNSA